MSPQPALLEAAIEIAPPLISEAPDPSLDTALAFDLLSPGAAGAVVPAWRDLAARAVSPNVLFEPEMALAAVAHLSGCGRTHVAVVRARGEGTLLGLLPVTDWPSFPGASALLAGDWNWFGPLGAPLLDPRRPEAAAAALLDGIARGTGARLLILRGVPVESAAAAALAAAIHASGRRLHEADRHVRAQLATTLPGEAYVEAAISGKKRKELRRQLRRLEEEVGPVSLSFAAGEALAPAFDDFCRLEDAGWKGRSGSSLLKKPEHLAFLRATVLSLGAQGMARIAQLVAGETLVGSGVLLQSQDTAWYFKTAYDESLARFSPGVQLTLGITEALADDPTVGRADSTAVADHPMIDHIWRERFALADWLIELRPRDPVFPLALKAELGRRALRTTARDIVRSIRELRR